jgi:signal transduction histidine kinase
MNGTDLIQVLLNLVINAFQCVAQPHQVTVDGQLLPHSLELTRFKDTSQERVLNVEVFDNAAPILALAVRDNGPGIPTEVLPQIFNPYFTTKSNRQGTGLGLNIVQRLVKQARGILHVRTKIGEGTTFTVFLPATRAAATSATKT